MYWKHFLSLSQSWSLIHTGYNELFLKAGAELGLGEGGSEEKEEEEEGRSVRRNRRGERSRGPVCINKNETKRNSESANTRFEGGYWVNSRRITKTNGGLQKNI